MKVLEFSGYDYATGIAAALKSDFGESTSTIKAVCEVTGATPGTVKKWFAEENGPGGEYLVKLMYASPAVRRFIDASIQREDQITRKEDRLRRALAIVDEREEAPGSDVIELIPTLQEDLFDRRPPAPSRGQRMADKARAASYGRTR
jgi:hypothetical protein